MLYRNLLLILILSILILPLQALKELVIKPGEAHSNAIYTDFPNCAVVVIETDISSLEFKSNMGAIVSTKRNPSRNNYVIYIKPEKQIISINGVGIRSADLPQFRAPKAKEVFYYQIFASDIASGKGDLIIASVPEGAKIVINNIADPDLTPKTYTSIPSGEHTIRLSKDNYRDSTFVWTVKPNQLNKVTINLIPAYGDLEITSKPPNARVSIDGKVYPPTPVSLKGYEDGITTGKHHLKLSANRYKEHSQDIFVKPGQNKYDITLEPEFGELIVNVEPAEARARIWLDNNDLGEAPISRLGSNQGLAPGTYTLKIVPQNRDYDEIQESITISTKKETRVDKYLKSNTASLRIDSGQKPFSVQLNGSLNRELSAGQQIPLKAGTYKLRIEYEGTDKAEYNPHSLDISLSASENKVITAVFPSKRVAFSIQSDRPAVNIELFSTASKQRVLQDQIGVTAKSFSLLPGTYYLIATKARYLSHERIITVSAGTAFQIDLLPERAVISLENKISLPQIGGLKVEKKGSRQYEITWHKASGVSGYIIDRKPENGDWQMGVITLHPDLNLWIDDTDINKPEYRIYSYRGAEISLPSELPGKKTPPKEEKKTEKITTHTPPQESSNIKEPKKGFFSPGLSKTPQESSNNEKPKPNKNDPQQKSTDAELSRSAERKLSEKEIPDQSKTKSQINTSQTKPSEPTPTSKTAIVVPDQIVPGMIFVEGGIFRMGSDEGGEDEVPVRSVFVESFHIGKYEVTQKEWESLMGSNPSQFKDSMRPVESINWYQAIVYCNKLSLKDGLQICYTLPDGSDPSAAKKIPHTHSKIWNDMRCDWTASGYRLPTEAEWEYAAKGGKSSQDYPYSGAEEIGNVAWYSGNSNKKTQIVGSKKPNELGIYDMTGNVSEWCWDWYSSSYYTQNDNENPRGTPTGYNRSNRGGTWKSAPWGSRMFKRRSDATISTMKVLGLRIARNANAQSGHATKQNPASPETSQTQKNVIKDASPSPQQLQSPPEKTSLASDPSNQVQPSSTRLPSLKKIDSIPYPAIIRQQGITGSVVLQVLLDASAKVTEVKVIRSLQSGKGGADELAMKAAKEAIYEGGMRNGINIESSIILEASFILSGRGSTTVKTLNAYLGQSN